MREMGIAYWNKFLFSTETILTTEIQAQFIIWLGISWLKLRHSKHRVALKELHIPLSLIHISNSQKVYEEGTASHSLH